MKSVELYARVRRAVLVEGRSERGVAHEFGLARETVRKMLRHSVPPGYRRQQPVRRPKLGPWLGVIDAILEEDKTKPAKQRHTAISNNVVSVKSFLSTLLPALRGARHFALVENSGIVDPGSLLIFRAALSPTQPSLRSQLRS